MSNLLRRLLGLNGHEEIKALKEKVKIERDLSLAEMKKLNKRFKIQIESGTIEIVIKNIKEITKGK